MTQSHIKLPTSKEHKSQQHEEPRSESGMLNDSKSSPTQSTGGMEKLDTPSTYTRKIRPPLDWTQTTETNPQLPNQPINPIPPHQYPNGHLDPNINIDLQRNQRQRRPPNRYKPPEWTVKHRKINRRRERDGDEKNF